MLFTRQLLLVLLHHVFCNAAAAEDAAPPMRKRTQRRHIPSGSSAHLRGGSKSNVENFDPFIGVPRELRSVSLSMSMLMSMGQSMPLSMPQTLTPTTTAPAVEEPSCEDPDQTPLEVKIVTDSHSVLDGTGYTLISNPDDGSEPVTYLERASGSMSDSKTYTESICLPKGSYNFTVYDDFYGLQDEGEYSVKIRGTEIVWGKGFQAQNITHNIIAGYDPEMTEEDDQWLVAHNERRKKFHEENGKIFKPLFWSDSLKQAAANYAAAIAPTCQVTEKTDAFGHNIAIVDLRNVTESRILPENVVHVMFDRKLALGLGFPDNREMTQIAWRGTRYVGCASLIEEMATGHYCHLSVCKYSRPGNCFVNETNWLERTLADRSTCGQMCPAEGCH
jgi:hypothetical protein